MIPGDREDDRRVEQDVEIVSIVRTFVEVTDIDHHPTTECLLNAEIHVMASAWRQRLTLADKVVGADAGREQQVFVVRRFQCASVRRTQDGVAPRNGVGDTEPWLRAGSGGQPIVMIDAKPELEGRVS